VKIYIANLDIERTGGGWSFQHNFYSSMGNLITQDYNEADVYFITSPSMVSKEDVEQAKTDGKKIVLRIDNAVRNSRNRNTGMSRMKKFADMADLVIYQSTWAKNYLLPFTKADGRVILNGTDTSVFNTEGRSDNEDVLYSRFNRDETKNWEVARYWYSQYQLEHPDAKLNIIGQFSNELKEYNFDFYNNENIQYSGVLDRRNLAKLYKANGKFLYTYFNDACSNSLIEALCCGCEIVGDEYYRETGGAPEILHNFKLYGADYYTNERMATQYEEAINGIIV